MTPLEYTVSEMYRLAWDYSTDVDRLNFTTLGQVFYYVANVPYVTDAKDCRAAECLKRPSITMERGGDCDDKTILAGAAFNRMAIPWRIVTVAFNGEPEPTHVYAEVFAAGQWRPFDATYSSNTLFGEPTYTTKTVWDMKSTTRLGVTTLEGTGDTIPNAEQWKNLFTAAGKEVLGGSFDVKTVAKNVIADKASAIIAAAVPIPVIGGMVAAAGALILSMLGVRKPTEHLPVADAERQSQNIAQAVVNVYRALPQDGKTYLATLCTNYLNTMVAKFGDWWGGMDLGPGDDAKVGLLNRIMTNQNRHPEWWDTEEKRVYNSVWLPMYVILRAADLSTVKENFDAWAFSGNFVPVVVKPLSTFIETRLKQTVQFNQDGTISLTPQPGNNPIANATSNPTFWIVAAGAVLMVASLFKRKSR